MNDDFEKRLQRQSLRQIPAAWRDEVLGAAQAAMAANEVRSAVRTRPTWRQWPGLVGLKLWHELFWPSRYAWGGFAAVWRTMLVVNESIYDGGTSAQAKAAPTSAEIIQAAQAQRRMLAELADSTLNYEADRVRTVRPRPHSQRQREIAVT